MRPASTRTTRGFTLIEVVVVVLVVGLLASLLLGGIMAARETARRTGCLNNLKQIGLAMQSYTAAIQIMPMGNNGRGYSVLCMLLPHLDQAPLYNQLNFSVAVEGEDSEANGTVAAVRVATFLCPSDSGSSDAAFPAFTSYAGNRGIGVQKYGYNGAFGLELNGPLSLGAFSDGTATTAAFCEWLSGGDPERSTDERRLVFRTVRPLTSPVNFDQFITDCQTSDQTKPARGSSTKGSLWIRGEYRQTLYNHTIVPNGRSCLNGGLIQEGAWTVASGHRSGVNLLMVDGHVQWVGARIAAQPWQALGSRDGGELISSSALEE